MNFISYIKETKCEYFFSDLKDKNIDGKNVWDALSKDTASDRNEILHNIDDIWGSSALTVSEWKVVKGTNYNGIWDSWYGPSGDRNIGSYNITLVLNCPTGKALDTLKLNSNEADIRQGFFVFVKFCEEFYLNFRF